jgi:hypothetical protein
MEEQKIEERKLPQGWGFPALSKKAHYFREGELRSMCGKWLYGGEREDDRHDHSENCADCKKRRAKHFAVNAS